MNPPDGSSDFSSIMGGGLERDLPSPQEALSNLADRIAKMELALEQVSLSSKYQTELARYVEDLRVESADILAARRSVGRIAMAGAIVLFIGPIAIMIAQPPWFMRLPIYLQAALLIAMFAAGVLLLQGMAKSVFRSAHERQSDEFIPPQIKAIHELTGLVKP